ncbi:MAG TPA: DUF4240 domain-containing protein [Streptosporangiaceae bacterium]
MDIGTFWDIIDTARASSGPHKRFDRALVDYLATCTQQDILEYQERFDEVHAALYRWDVWAAAYLIAGGCSDDSFLDFRAGLIAQGREWCQTVASSPDSLADHPVVADDANRFGGRDLFCEEVNYAARYAFERVTGEKDGFNIAWSRYRDSRQHSHHSPADMGEDFDFDDAQQIRRRLPRLSALYLPNGST